MYFKIVKYNKFQFLKIIHNFIINKCRINLFLYNKYQIPNKFFLKINNKSEIHKITFSITTN